jgi:hypothetical protein
MKNSLFPTIKSSYSRAHLELLVVQMQAEMNRSTMSNSLFIETIDQIMDIFLWSLSRSHGSKDSHKDDPSTSIGSSSMPILSKDAIESSKKLLDSNMSHSASSLPVEDYKLNPKSTLDIKGIEARKIVEHFVKENVPSIMLDYFESILKMNSYTIDLEICFLKAIHELFCNISTDVSDSEEPDTLLVEILSMRDGRFLYDLLITNSDSASIRYDIRIEDVATRLIALIKTLTNRLNAFLSPFYFCPYTYNIPVLKVALELIGDYDPIVSASCRQAILYIFSRMNIGCLEAYHDTFPNTFKDLWQILLSWLDTMKDMGSSQSIESLTFSTVEMLFSEHCDILLFFAELMEILSNRIEECQDAARSLFQSIIKTFETMVKPKYMIYSLDTGSIKSWNHIWAIIHVSKILFAHFPILLSPIDLIHIGMLILTVQDTDPNNKMASVTLLLLSDALVDYSKNFYPSEREQLQLNGFFFHVYKRLSHQSTQPMEDWINEVLMNELIISETPITIHSDKLYKFICNELKQIVHHA